ncbi:MAG: hypothetical protein HYX68_13600 [Planctomycetes bacterium]|jgi:hypothetical protein|nr:hypothetical protein [Planctomycetota bacterium]
MVCFKQHALVVLLVGFLVLPPELATGQETKPVERPRPELPTPVSADKLTRTQMLFRPNGTIQIAEKQIGKPDAFPPQSAVKPEQDSRQGVLIRPGRTLPSITIDGVPQGLLVLGGLFAVCYLAARIFAWAIARPITPDRAVK